MRLEATLSSRIYCRVWFDRLLERIQNHPGPVILEGGEAYGAPFLLDALGERQKLAWMQISPVDAKDGIALGNVLADAINSSLHATLLPHALPFTFGMELLKSQLPHIGPLYLACSNANYNTLFQNALLSLHGDNLKIVLDVDEVIDVPEGALYLNRSEIRLTETEARVLAGVLEQSQTEMLLAASRGAYYTFLTSLHRIKGEPDPLLPSPTGSLVPADRERLVSPDALLDTLMQLKRYVEALDLAVMKFPGRVPEVLKEAGPVYQDKGLIGRLYLLLQSLEPAHQDNEEVLEWLFVGAAGRGEYRDMVPRVEDFLAKHEAPELRARYAATLHDSDRQLAEIQRAAAQHSSPLSLFQLGRLHPDPAEGVSVLTESVRVAEEHGRPYDIARNAGALAQRLLHVGSFEQASIWAEWALRVFDQNQLKDGSRRLHLLNIWAYSRLLIGETVGLDVMLRDTEKALANTGLGLVELFRSTLAELELSRGNLVKAERLALDNLMHSPRRLLGSHAVTAVRVLLEQGEVKRALLEGKRAFELTAGEADDFALPAALALGMAQSFEQPEKARSHLVRVMDAKNLAYEYRAMAALHLLLPLGGNDAAVPDDQITVLKTIPLGGLKLLSGPEQVFSNVWQELLGTNLPLHISVLGTPQVTLHGQPIKLQHRQLEILTLLALSPKGLSLEALHTALYEDVQASIDGLKVLVTRLRKAVPIGTQPYRISTPFYLDARACEEHLDEGKVRAALGLYRGAVFPESDAPGILEARGWLEERIRQAALNSGDVEVLYAFGGILKNDLEVWEAALASLPRGDPRVPLVRAHLENAYR